MKLLNHTLSYLSVAFLLVIGVWAVLFYISFLDEIYDSIDDGLDNSKMLIIQRMRSDSSIVHKTDFMESNYAIREITQADALPLKDRYIDSTLYMINEKDYEPVRILKSAFRTENGKYYELQVVSSMVEEDDLIADLLYSLIVLYVILIASILVINNVILRRIWRPFYQTLGQLKDFEVDKQSSLSLSPSGVTEFQMLNNEITSLVRRTSETFRSQRQFIENAAHELQTPLAISINKLELIAEHSSANNAITGDIGSVIQSLERLKRLNNSLLLLSKIENRQFSNTVRVDLKKITEQVIEDYSDLAEFKSVTVSLRADHSLLVEMNQELATIMISNLMKNALVHNVPSGLVEIHLSPSGFRIENTGIIHRLDDAQIFNRFYKASSHDGSTGLGLAIVKSITEHYGFNIQYKFSDKHVFEIVIHS